MPLKREWTALLLAMMVCAEASAGQNNFSSDRSQEPVTLLVEPSPQVRLGEKLEYEVFWMGVPIGLGELWVKERVEIGGRPALHIVAVARTNDFLSKIYPVRDEVHSWVDAETFDSLQFEKKVSEGRYRADERIVYDYPAAKGHYESFRNGSKKEFAIKPPVHDIVSSFYWIRRQPLEPGRTLRSQINSEEKDWDLEVKVMRREKRDFRGLGTVDTVAIEPRTRLKGVLEKRGRVIVHLENDAYRTPVRVTLNTPYGVIVGALKKKDRG